MKLKKKLYSIKISADHKDQNQEILGLNLSHEKNEEIESFLHLRLKWQNIKSENNFANLYLNSINKAFLGLSNSNLIFQKYFPIIFSHLTFSKITGSDKLPLRIWQLTIIINFINSHSQKFPLIIILEDYYLYKVINNLHNGVSHKTRELFSSKQLIIFSYIYGILSIFKGFLKSLLKNIYLRFFKIGIVNIENHSVLYQTIVPKNISNTNQSYDDYYFGNSWRSIHNSFLLVKDIDSRNSKIKLMKELTNNKYISVTANLALSDILVSLIESIKLIFKPLKVIEDDLIDNLINQNLREESRSSRIFYNYCDYLAISRILKKAKQNQLHIKIYMPFEGKVIEKMLFLNKYPNIQFNGYMHFPLSERHLSMRFTDVEKAIVPNNFKIQTIGKYNQKILINNGWIKNNTHILGSIKKTSKNIESIIKENDKINILFALSMDEEPNNNFLKIVEEILIQRNSKFQIIIRPHPSLPRKYLKNLKSKYPYCDIDTKSDISSNLFWADILIYGECSVCVDSLDYDLSRIYVKDCIYLDSNRIAPSLEHYAEVKNSEELMKLFKFISKNLEQNKTKGSTEQYYEHKVC